MKWVVYADVLRESRTQNSSMNQIYASVVFETPVILIESFSLSWLKNQAWMIIGWNLVLIWGWNNEQDTASNHKESLKSTQLG